MPMRPNLHIHPLRAFFHSRKFTAAEGMNWLQGRGTEKHGALISDNAVMPEDVAMCDVVRVLRLAGNGAEQFIPPEMR